MSLLDSPLGRYKQPLSLLVEFGTNADPLKSLSGVPNHMGNATVKSQWAKQCIQVVEELCNDKRRHVDETDEHFLETQTGHTGLCVLWPKGASIPLFSFARLSATSQYS